MFRCWISLQQSECTTKPNPILIHKVKCVTCVSNCNWCNIFFVDILQNASFRYMHRSLFWTKGENICTDYQPVSCMFHVRACSLLNLSHGCKRHARAWLASGHSGWSTQKIVWYQLACGSKSMQAPEDLASLETPVHIVVCILKMHELNR
jgi:hypothetical protein